MRFQTLISTMNGNFYKKNMNLSFDHIVINQYDSKPIDKKMNNLFQFQEKGLAKSRNHAIALAEGDICHISDDDLQYKENIAEVIQNAFFQYPEADIITFQIKTPKNEPYKRYKNQTYWHTKKTLMGVSSVEIAFRKKSIHRIELKFDETFGLGSIFPTGEEIIFLTDALKKGLKIAYVPLPIVIHPIESSGKNYDSMALIKAKGAMFYRIFSWKGYTVSILFAYKKYTKSPFSFIQFSKLMFKGIQQYRRNI